MKINFKREPVAWVNVIKLALQAGALFGLNLSNAQLIAVIAVLEAIGGLIVRQNVYAPVDKEGAPVMVAGKPAPVADPDPKPPEVLHVESDPDSPRLHQWTEEELMKKYLEEQRLMKGGTP